VYLTGWGTISVHKERPQISDARQKKNELIFKLLAHFQNTELKVKKKKSFKPLLATKVRNTWQKLMKHFGSKNRFKF